LIYYKVKRISVKVAVISMSTVPEARDAKDIRKTTQREGDLHIQHKVGETGRRGECLQSPYLGGGGRRIMSF
jgi:hypothetical protein